MRRVIVALAIAALIVATTASIVTAVFFTTHSFALRFRAE